VGSSEESHLTFTEGFDEDLLEEPCFPEKKMFSENIQLKEIDLVNRTNFKMASETKEVFMDDLSSIEQSENIARKPAIPPLDFSKLKGVQAKPVQKQTKQSQSVSLNKAKPLGKPMFKLNFESLNKQEGFQDEFMGKLEEYSESWREAALKEQRH
jgi:hypothetical protein